jgi:hypothetical protein
MVEQDENLAAQRSRERVEQVADLAVAQLSSALAEWDRSLRDMDALPPPPAIKAHLPSTGILARLTSQSITTYPDRPVVA